MSDNGLIDALKNSNIDSWHSIDKLKVWHEFVYFKSNIHRNRISDLINSFVYFNLIQFRIRGVYFSKQNNLRYYLNQ